MRKIISNFFISLDGVVESPGEWSMSFWNDEIQEAVQGGMEAADTMLLGRVTYEEFAPAWTERTTEEDAGSDFMNDTRKYVASSTLRSADWNNTSVLSGDLATTVAGLKAEEGGDIMTSGSGTLVRSLLGLGLVDELNLLVYPLTLGSGKRLFTENSPNLGMTLLRSSAFGNGVLNLVYAPSLTP